MALFFRRHGNWSGVMASWRKPNPELLPVHRPLCPKCQRRMRTTAVSDGPEGFERRGFECLKCTVTEIRTLASDPMKSDAVRWLSGELGRRSREAEELANKARDNINREFRNKRLADHDVELWSDERFVIRLKVKAT